MGRLRRWKDVANVATPPDETCSEAPKTESTERFFQVENHLHLSLSLRLGAIYPEAELRRRCPQDKLPKLEKCLSDSSMLKEVAVPENLKGKEPSRQAATPKRSGPSEEDARRLKRRALSKKLCLGQLVWDCSTHPARPARIIAICAQEKRPFLVRHLDTAPGSPNFAVNDVVSVNGRPGVVTWDGRPQHQFAKVRFEDGKESDVLPVCSLQANKPPVEEEVFVSDFDLESLELSHLLRPGIAGPTPSSAKPTPGTLAVPAGIALNTSEAKAALHGLRAGQVCWSFGGSRLPWPVKLLQECPETRTWKVRFLGAEWREESLSVACLRPYVEADSAVLAGVLKTAEEEHAKCCEAAAEKASASKDAATELEAGGDCVPGPVAVNSTELEALLIVVAGERAKTEDQKMEALPQTSSGKTLLPTNLQLEKAASKRPLPTVRLEQILQDSAFPEEVLDGSNQWMCPRCDRKACYDDLMSTHVDARRTTRLSKLPPYLHVTVERYHFDAATAERRRLAHPVSFPRRLELKLAGSLAGSEVPSTGDAATQPVAFECIGYLEHVSDSAHSGHYRATLLSEGEEHYVSAVAGAGKEDEATAEPDAKRPKVCAGADAALLANEDLSNESWRLDDEAVTEAAGGTVEEAASWVLAPSPLLFFLLFNHVGQAASTEDCKMCMFVPAFGFPTMLGDGGATATESPERIESSTVGAPFSCSWLRDKQACSMFSGLAECPR
ncbi:UBP26 [Symbiodinium sp. KB8]|nr:UBP26 [Symbiodinium sp. KB8]